MIEINFAKETLAIVQAFLLLGMHTQWIYRIILSRLYYAAHHVGKALLRSDGLMPDRWRGSVHRRVLDELELRFVDTGIMELNALEALENLRWLRIIADYDLNRHIRKANITDALRFFETYFNECCQILGVSE